MYPQYNNNIIKKENSNDSLHQDRKVNPTVHVEAQNTLN
jgi:hypothetical protein